MRNVPSPLMFLLLIFLLSCNSKKIVEKNYENGKLKNEVWIEKDKLFFKEYYANGSPVSFGEVEKNGDKKGPWKYYHEDGKIKAEGVFRDDFRESVWKYNFRGFSYEIEWQTYTDRPIRINIPSSWLITKDSLPGMPLFVMDKRIDAAISFNVFVYEKITDSIQHFISKEIERNSVSGYLKVNSRNKVVIKKKEAYEVVYDIIAGKKLLVGLQYFFSIQDKVYLVSFFIQKEAFERSEMLINEIAYSFSVF